MSFDWSQYLVLARELATTTSLTSPEEARLRCAISRAYYAAFHEALDALVRLHEWTEEDAARRLNRHEQVRLAFEESRTGTVRVKQNIAVHLQRLCRLRNQSDYDRAIGKLPDVTRLSLHYADVIVDSIRALA